MRDFMTNQTPRTIGKNITLTGHILGFHHIPVGNPPGGQRTQELAAGSTPGEGIRGIAPGNTRGGWRTRELGPGNTRGGQRTQELGPGNTHGGQRTQRLAAGSTPGEGIRAPPGGMWLTPGNIVSGHMTAVTPMASSIETRVMIKLGTIGENTERVTTNHLIIIIIFLLSHKVYFQKLVRIARLLKVGTDHQANKLKFNTLAGKWRES